MKMSLQKIVGFLAVLQLGYGCSKNGNSDNLPTLNTVTINAVTTSSVVVSGTISNAGGTSIIRNGFCWSRNPQPTVDSNFLNSRNSTSSGSFVDTIRGLIYNTRYYIRAFAQNSIGIAYSQTTTVVTQQSSYSIGQSFGGGYIFYIDSTGEHGLIAATPLGRKTWANWPYAHTLVGTTSAEIGTGRANTQAIISATNNDPSTAAKVCDNLVVNGYNDWYLPSVKELYVLRQNANSIPFFGQLDPANWIYFDLYWSSTEVTDYLSYIMPINATSTFNTDDKERSWSVVPIRSF